MRCNDRISNELISGTYGDLPCIICRGAVDKKPYTLYRRRTSLKFVFIRAA